MPSSLSQEIYVLGAVRFPRALAYTERTTLVSAIAAGVQQVPSRWHNDVYHIVQLGSLWLMYRGAMVMSAGNAMTEQPAIKNAR